MVGWWRHRWTDQRLTWNPRAWGDLQFVTFSSTDDGSDIWQPDVCIYETIETDRILNRIDYLVHHTGLVTTSIPRKDYLYCPMDLTMFPFDTQTCSFTLGSWMYNGHKLGLEPWGKENPVDLSNYKKDSESEFVLDKIMTRHEIKYYGIAEIPYPTVSRPRDRRLRALSRAPCSTDHLFA